MFSDYWGALLLQVRGRASRMSRCQMVGSDSSHPGCIAKPKFGPYIGIGGGLRRKLKPRPEAVTVVPPTIFPSCYRQCSFAIREKNPPTHVPKKHLILEYIVPKGVASVVEIVERRIGDDSCATTTTRKNHFIACQNLHVSLSLFLKTIKRARKPFTRA